MSDSDSDYECESSEDYEYSSEDEEEDEIFVKRLVKEGTINIQYPTPGWSDTPLHRAVTSGNRKLVELLLQNGADFTLKSGRLQYTPFHYAANYGWGKFFYKKYRKEESTIDLFVKYGADIESKAGDGNTPLMVSAMDNNTYEIHELIKYGAKINATNDKGQTALHLAAIHHSDDGVKTLLEYDTMCLGILNKKDKKGMTALDYAFALKRSCQWSGYSKPIVELISNAIRKKKKDNKKTRKILQKKISEKGIVKNIMAMKYELEKC